MGYLKKLITIGLASSIIGGSLLTGINVQASTASYSGWKQINGSWYCYKNGTKLTDTWVSDSTGWCYLNPANGEIVKNAWALDSKGWCYLDSNGYWVNHAALAKDSIGYCIIGDDGYWTGARQTVNSQSKVEAAKNVASIVAIETLDGEGNIFAKASGCIISADGKVITNYHIIDGATSIKVMLQDGTSYEIEGLLAFSREKDIAVLKLNNAAGLTPVIMGDSDMLQLGEEIITIRNPGGYFGTVSDGIVSGLHRLNFDLRQGEDIQISAPITSGSSGGGLFNMNGQLVGITYAGNLGTGNLNFVIPINDVKNLLPGNSITLLKDINFINP